MKKQKVITKQRLDKYLNMKKQEVITKQRLDEYRNMKKQKVITKQRLDEYRNNSQIRSRINELKQEMRQYTSGRVAKLYEICTEIVELKRALPENRGVGKNYTMRSLEWEEDLDLTAMEIRYIQSYIFISDYAHEKIKEGLLRDSTICHFLTISSLLREEKYQNKLIDKILMNKIKISEVSELTKDELKAYLDGKMNYKSSDRYFLTSAKTMRSILTRLKSREATLKKNPLYKKQLLNSIIKLKNYIETI